MLDTSFAHLQNFTAATLLAIPVDEPGRLYSGDATRLEQEYRVLAKIWHPDRNKNADAAAVFAHIAALKSKGLAALATGNWRKPGLLELQSTTGKNYRIRYHKRHAFELGEFYIGRSVVAYALEPQFKDLYEVALKQLNGFRFADDKMKAEAGHFLPRIKASFVTNDRLFVVMEKAEDQVLLADLMVQQGGALDPKHAAWVISRLGNISCYLHYAGLTHNAISTATVFVSPASHAASLLGGWWYSAAKGKALTAMPDASLAVTPPDILAKKHADPRIDLELIRAAGRAMLGDTVGTRLRHDKTIPRPLAEWLTLPPFGNAVENYRAWQETVLPQSFGPRRFVKLNVGFEDIYPQP